MIADVVFLGMFTAGAYLLAWGCSVWWRLYDARRATDDFLYRQADRW